MSERLTVIASPHFVVRPEQLARLGNAHPLADVKFVSSVDEFSAALPEADAAVTGYPLSGELLARAPRLRWVQAMAAGVERFLTPELRAAQLTLTATKGPMGVLMAEHAVALMLALARDLPRFFDDQRERRWRRYPGERGPLTELCDKTILILGIGTVGGELARICKLGFQMRVLGMSRTARPHPHVDRGVDRADLPSALAEADIVSLSLPVTPSTKHIIDAAALAAMKQTALLINVARGQLIDELALIAALQRGRLGGVGLDAFAGEPLAPDSPLWSLPGVIVTPHTSAITDHLGDRFVAFWSENIRRFAEGKPLLGLVDQEAGY